MKTNQNHRGRRSEGKVGTPSRTRKPATESDAGGAVTLLVDFGKDTARLKHVAAALGKDPGALVSEIVTTFVEEEDKRRATRESDRLFSFMQPISLGLPGNLKTEMDDETFFPFVRQVVSVDGDELRKYVVPKITELWNAADLAEMITLCERWDENYFPAEIGADGALKKKGQSGFQCLPGLSRQINRDHHDVLYLVCSALYENRDLIQREIITGNITDHPKLQQAECFHCLEWYQTLLIAEAVVGRAEGWVGRRDERLDQNLKHQALLWQLRCHGAAWDAQGRAA